MQKRLTVRNEQFMYFLLILSLIFSLFCLIPYVMGSKYHDNDAEALNSEFHLDSLLLSIVACGVISIDGLLDYLFGSLNTVKTSLPRWCLLLSLIGPDAVMFFVYKSHPTKTGITPELFSTMTTMREILFQSSLLTFLISSSSKDCEFCYGAVVTQIALIAGLIIFQYDNFMAIPAFLIYIAYISILVSAMLILWMLFSQFRKLSKSNHQKRRENGDLENMIYILCLGFNIFVRYLVFLVTWVTLDLANGYQSAIFNCIDVVTVLIIISVHGRKSREEALLFQNQLARKKTFVKYISHEIRTPLNIISLGIKYLVDNIDNLHRQSQLDELRESLYDIQESSDVAICTLNNILAFETLDTGELTLITKETSPISFIPSIVKMFKIQAAQAGVELKYEGPDCLPSTLQSIACLMDTNKMGQVLRNLVSNALKFTKSGGSVTVKAYHKVFDLTSPRRRSVTGALAHLYSPSIVPNDRDYLVIEVVDTGIGMSEENCRQLFTRAIQFDTIDIQNGNGSGLGLMISKSIVEAHGGRIFVRSVPQVGSTFTVMLKCYERPQENCSDIIPIPASFMMSKKEEKSDRMDTRRIVPEPGTDVPSPLSLSAKPPYIMDSCLIVDDSSLNRKLLQKHLRPHFKTIFTAENGLEAIEEVKKMIAEDRMFDLICLDSVMPEMGGPEAIVQIRKLKYSGLVVGVTGNALPEQISSFKVAGVDEVLPKPVDIAELLSVLQHHRRFSSV